MSGAPATLSEETRLYRIGAKGPGLNRHEARTVARVAVVAVQAALHELAGEHRPIVDGHHVADQHLSQTRRERRFTAG